MLPGLLKGWGRDQRVLNGKTKLREKAGCILGRCIETLEERRLLSAPTIDTISDAQVLDGRSLILPITASDSDGDRLTYTVTSSNPDISVALHTGNPFLKLTVSGSWGSGEMVFELLRDVAPRTVDTIAGLVQAGYYDGLTFHRVIKDFMIQGGDPAGNGTGISGSVEYPGFEFDDEFNSSALFTGKGQLAMAKASDDTNGSQFFITDSSPRWLDFQHTIFGQLVRGMDVVQKIEAVSVDSNNKPTTSVTITKAELIDNRTDAVITLGATPTAAGPATITVTADDGNGGIATQTFQVQTGSDSNSIQPILGTLSDAVTPVDTPITIQVPTVNMTDAASYIWAYSSQLNGGVPWRIEGNSLTITPPSGFSGALDVTVGVTTKSDTDPSVWSTYQSYFDTQTIRIGVGDEAITGQASPLMTKATQAGVYTVATFTDADLNGVVGNFTAKINWGDGPTTEGGQGITDGTITRGEDGTFTVSGSCQYAHNGVYPITVTVTGDKGARMIVRGQATIAGLNLGVDTTVKEGNEFARTISLGTPSDGWTVTADYGQGAQPVELSASGFFTLRLVPDDNGSKTITVAANHTSGMSLSDSLVLTIQNVAPTAAITGPTFILAGQSAAVDLSATDPSSADTTGGFSYSIDWKDGSAVQTIAAGDPSTNLTHLYGTPGTYAIEVKATDKDGMTSTAKTLGMTVLAETLSLGAAVRMNEGGTMSRAESLGIVGDGWTVTADYGDGPQDLTVNSNGTFTLSHAYPDNGNNTIAVVATHAASGTMRNGTLSVVVGNAVPTATASGATWGLMGQNLSLKLAASDPSPTDKTAGFSYSINWKDGSAVQAVATGVSSVSHAFADAGTYKVEIRATDKEGATGPVQTYTVTILPVALEADPADATKTSLRVMGTDEADTIRLLWAKDNRVKVVLNDTTLGAFKPTGSVRVFGRGGNDVISVASGLTIRAELHGGHGNDTLVGGSGNDILLGEAGGDVLTGMAGRDLLIGGPAADKLDGGAGDDILIAGTTNYDVAPVSLGKLMAEWTNSAVTYAKRVTHLTGGRGGYNGKLWLTRQSVFSDSRIDALTSGAGSDLFFYTKGEDAAKDLAAPEYGLAG